MVDSWHQVKSCDKRVNQRHDQRQKKDASTSTHQTISLASRSRKGVWLLASPNTPRRAARTSPASGRSGPITQQSTLGGTGIAHKPRTKEGKYRQRQEDDSVSHMPAGRRAAEGKRVVWPWNEVVDGKAQTDHCRDNKKRTHRLSPINQPWLRARRRRGPRCPTPSPLPAAECFRVA